MYVELSSTENIFHRFQQLFFPNHCKRNTELCVCVLSHFEKYLQIIWCSNFCSTCLNNILSLRRFRKFLAWNEKLDTKCQDSELYSIMRERDCGRHEEGCMVLFRLRVLRGRGYGCVLIDTPVWHSSSARGLRAAEDFVCGIQLDIWAIVPSLKSQQSGNSRHQLKMYTQISAKCDSITYHMYQFTMLLEKQLHYKYLVKTFASV